MRHLGRGRCIIERLESRTFLSTTWTLLTESGGLGFDFVRGATEDRIFFQGNDDQHGMELWTSDGTVEGTHLLADLNPGSEGTHTPLVGTMGRHAFFYGSGLWKTDGTTRGTVLLRGMQVSVDGTNYRGGAAYKGAFYFAGDDGAGGQALWRTNGTAVGTRMIKRLNSSEPAFAVFRVLNEHLFIVDGVVSLWVSDGTSAGTKFLARDIQTNGIPDARVDLAAAGEHVIFATRNGMGSASANSGWAVQSFSVRKTGVGMAQVGHRVLFVSDQGLRQTDGKAIWPVSGMPVVLASYDAVAQLGDKALLSRYDREMNRAELWITDGTAAGTSLVTRHGGFGTSMGDLHVFASGAYLTDGTASGTLRIPFGPTDERVRGDSRFLQTADGLFLLGYDVTTRPMQREVWYLSPPGRISGVVFHDVNADGRVQAGERRLKGFRVFVDKNANGRFDSGEPSALSDARGEYRLPYLNAGQYRVAVSGVPGWSSSGTARASISPARIARKHFAMQRAAVISGAVFADNNQDRRRGSREPGLSGWRVFVDADDDGVLDAGERSVTSDANGNWVFPDLPAGTHIVRIVQKSGWRLTTPSGGAFVVSAVVGLAKGGLLFGQKRIG